MHGAVLSIRGTLSLEDCMTDFLCEPAALNEWIESGPKSDSRRSFDEAPPAVQLASRGDTVTAHAGILEAAKAVVADLQVVSSFKLLAFSFSISILSFLSFDSNLYLTPFWSSYPFVFPLSMLHFLRVLLIRLVILPLYCPD